jgi:hypothetical protein
VSNALEVPIVISAAVLNEIIEVVAERVRGELAEASPWLTRPEAATYLRVPRSRLEKDRSVPAHRWEGRVLYHRGELDEWLRDR